MPESGHFASYVLHAAVWSVDRPARPANAKLSVAEVSVEHSGTLIESNSCAVSLRHAVNSATVAVQAALGLSHVVVAVLSALHES